MGAYKESVKRGVFLSEVIGSSAGSIVAVMIAVGASPDKLEEIVRKLDFSKFLKPPENLINFHESKLSAFIMKILPHRYKQYCNIISKLGMYNSSYIEMFVETHLREILKL